MEWADGELAALVRRVLPLRLAEWRVRVVDNPDEACARFSHNLVRVQRHWREAVYDAGLHTLTMHRPEILTHHPLSLVKLRGGSRKGIDIWNATGILRKSAALTEMRGYLVRTTDGKASAFNRNRKKAELLALEDAERSDRGARPVSPARMRRRRAMLADLASRTRYDGGFRVSAASYERWFPDLSLAVFRGYEPEDVPLVMVVNEAGDGLPDLQDHAFEDFMVQLRGDLKRAELVYLQESPRLAPQDRAPSDLDDEIALSELGLGLR
ncbi:hypothetical protein [Bradyrhizobium sp. Leaf401]|uniref:hypothetical protein n=1 Tax=Bradyrhizobium sp. Leaf401 TaxID=2876564 RepID=UPI001E3DD292|nr:hypothetical protein [Bradyrhizobium sp. Leaf401]